ncbi:hypothetical protein MBLNU230_g7278t1 [Neophaeotheca triangularis]
MVKTKKNTRMAEQHAASAAAKGRKLDVDVRGKLEVAPPLNGRIFTIIVGTAGKRFEIYEDLLKKHSEYFAAAIDGNQSREAEAFETFARFLYTGKIFTHCTDSSNKNHCETHSLKNAWVIGEYLLSTTFKDAVVDTYGISKLALRDMYKTVYRISQPTSGIRKLLVAEALYCEDKGWSLKHHDPAHEFFFDVANAFVANLMEKPNNVLSGQGRYESMTCEFHEHVGKEGKVCYKDLLTA